MAGKPAKPYKDFPLSPRASREGLTVRDLANRFLTAKLRQRDSGELAATSFRDYHLTCGKIAMPLGRIGW